MKTRRATLYFDPDVYRALKMKAAVTDQSLSALVSATVRLGLREDAEDLTAFRDRAKEPSLAFEDVLKDLRKRGRI